MADDIRTHIRIEADDAQRELSETGREMEDYGRTTGEAGEQSRKINEETDKQPGIMRNVASSVSTMVTSWLGFTAIGSAIVGLFDEIISRARRATQAVADVGEAVRDLSANVGGEQAAQAFKDVTLIASEQRLGLEGRTELLRGITAATDIRGKLTREQTIDLANNLATLRRATGVGGEGGFQTIQSLTANADLTDEQAVDAASVLLTSGISPQAVQDIAQTGGGVDFLSLVQAARQTGLDPNRVNRGLNTLIGALGRRDESGALAEDLRAVGISGDQSIPERFQQLVQLRASGQITEGQFRSLTGGEQLARLVDPLARAIQTPGAIGSARRALTDPNAAESIIEDINQNPFVRAAERRATGQLARQVADETFGLTDLGEELADFEVDFEGSNAVIRFLGQVGNLPAYLNPRDPELITALRQRQIRQRLGEPVKPLQQVLDEFAASKGAQSAPPEPIDTPTTTPADSQVVPGAAQSARPFIGGVDGLDSASGQTVINNITNIGLQVGVPEDPLTADVPRDFA